MRPPIYLVCGFPRSGTSMMMRALETGGIPCVYSPYGDADRNRNTLIPGYVPNPHGFYEDTDLTGWADYHGRAVKVIRDNLDTLPHGEELSAVYMRRNPVEIRRSYYGILSGPHDDAVFSFLDDYDAKVAKDMNLLATICSATLILNYAEVVANPVYQLARLGWPIDIAKSVSVIDPSLYRHRGAA